MTFSQHDDIVTLTMSQGEYEGLLLAVGHMAGACYTNKKLFYHWLQFANRMNADNPNWQNYEIPPEYQTTL